MKDKKYFSIPMQYEITNRYENDKGKIGVSLMFMHDGINLNNSSFDTQAMKDAEPSLSNIPLLGYIKKQDGTEGVDFAGHEMEVSVDSEGNAKVIVLERPLGVVPETHNLEYVEQDGKTFAKCDGVLWVDYLNDGYDILQNSPKKSVSMEIAVDDYEISDEGYIDITKYRYLGITILGDNVPPAMKGAHMETIGTFSEDSLLKDFYARAKILNDELVADDNKDDSADDKADDKNEKFELTYKDKMKLLYEALPKDTCEETEEYYNWQDTYVIDFADSYVDYRINGRQDGERIDNYYRASYSISENVAVVDFEAQEELFLELITKTEKDAIDSERNGFEAKIKELEESIEGFSVVEEELKAYKEEEQKRLHDEFIESANEIFEKYDEVIKENVEYDLIKEKVEEYTLEDLEKECKLIYADIALSNKTFSKKSKEKKSNQISVKKPSLDFEKNPYEGLNFKNKK